MKANPSPNYICMLGLFPFFDLYLRTNSTIAMVVALNGMIYHSTSQLKLWDILCNVAFIIHVVLFCADARIPAAIAAGAYVANKHFDSDLVHVFGVQLPLFVGLQRYLNMPTGCYHK